MFRKVGNIRISKEEQSIWESAFNLINSFKQEFDCYLRKIDYLNSDKEVYFSLYSKSDNDTRYNLYIKESDRSYWLTFETDTTVEDFVEKYNFLFKRE